MFTIVDSKTNELLRIYFDLNLSEAGQYVEIKDSGKRESTLKQVATGDIGKSGKDFPAYAGYIEFEIRSNFDLNLATKRYTKGTLFEHDKWDAYFTGPDTIVGDGNFSPTTLCVSTWGLKLYRLAAVDDDIIPSLVAVIIKPNNEQQEKSDVEVEKKNQQLNKILEKFSVGSTVDETATDSKSIRESVENYISAALAGDSKKTVEYTYPGSSVAAQTSYIYQALQGQNIRIVGMCIDKWNSWAISSAIKADQGRIGSIVFELRKVILEKKVLWLIDEIDLNKIDSIGEQIHYFIKVYPDAKTIIINPDTYTQKQTNERLDEKPQEKSSNPSLEKEGSSNNLPVKSPAPSAEDKSIVKVDLSVIEVPSDSKMDRETIVEIKNLLGGKITIPDSPAAGDLLRKAAGATEAVEDESADDKRVTQEKFNILLDLLVSRGYVKILMRPTLEVVDGETAQIISGQKIPRDRGALPTTQSDNKKTETEYEDVTDSIKITPHVSKDNNIILLQLEAVFSSLTMPHDDEKTPIVNRHETATLVRLGPGESGIISGTKQAGLITEPGKDVKDSELPATEIFVILTPAIVGSIEPKEPTETVNFENVEVRTIIEKLAEWSGKVVIPTADLMKQKITINTPQQLSRSEAVALILNSLRSNGYTVEQTDETIFIKHVKDEILIDAKILTASDEFLKYIGLDPNSAASSDGWSEYLVNSSDDSASFVIDQLHTDLILKATTIHKDARGLCSPQVLALSGKKFEIHMTDSEHYMLIGGPPDSNVFSVEPESESNPLELGTTIRMIPTLTPDGKNIELDFEWEYSRLRGFKEHTGPGGKVQKVPQIDVDSIKTSCNVPDGKTLLIAGKKIIEQKKKEARKPQLADLPLLGRLFYSPPQPEQTKNLLIMVTPSTDIKAWPIPQSLVDPNDPLIKKLEEKFNRSDETKQVITPVDSN